MTLKSFRDRLRGGKIRKKSLYSQEDFMAIKKAMELSSPGMTQTAMLHGTGQYTISFDAGKYNINLENKFKKLRKETGLDFQYRIDRAIRSDETRDKLDLARPAVQDRLVLTFSPKSDLDWVYIRTIFGVGTKITDEVSSEETINLVGED